METGPTTTTTREPQRLEVDGVPVLWDERPGRTRVALTFAVGIADEPLAWRGVTHLAEHLVLAPFGRIGDHNGATASTATVFHSSGDAAEMGDFLQKVCLQIVSGDLMTGFGDQVRMLQAEAAGHGPGLQGFHDVLRWGGRGLAASTYDEIGLGTLTPSHVRRWLDERFVAEAAVLLVSGPMPPNLTLRLPRGPRPVPRPLPAPRLNLPAYLPAPADTVSFSAIVPSSLTTSISIAILVDRLEEELRYRRAVSYSVRISVDHVDAEQRRLVVVMDAAPGTHAEVYRAAMGVLQKLTRQAVPQTELDGALRTLVMDEADDATRALYRTADAVLARRAVRSWAEQLAEVQQRGPVGIHHWMATMAATSLWLVPEGVAVAELPLGETPPQPPVTGRRYRAPRGSEHTWFAIVGDDGVTVGEDSVEETATVRWETCGAVVSYTDGRRIVLGEDGTTINLHPDAFADGFGLVRDVDARTPKAARTNHRMDAATPTVEAAEDDDAEASRARGGRWGRGRRGKTKRGD